LSLSEFGTGAKCAIYDCLVLFVQFIYLSVSVGEPA